VSNLDLAIGGRRYTVACTDGEETHVAELGKIVDAAITANGLRGQSESRMLLYAALMLADELHAARRDLASAASAPPALDPQTEQRVDAIALRLEALAETLDRTS
jgi:cell division protein ZapA